MEYRYPALVAGEEYLLLGGHGLGFHSVLGLALISAMRSLNLALSPVTVLYACGQRKQSESHHSGYFSFLNTNIQIPDTLQILSIYMIRSFIGLW